MFPASWPCHKPGTRISAKTWARATAREVAYTGIHWTFSPVLCMPRDLRWGRVNESLGEDGLMITRLGLAMIKGYQGDKVTDPNPSRPAPSTLSATAKARAGAMPRNRCIPGAPCKVLPVQLEAAAKAGCATFMSAYHAIDGVPIAFSRKLLSDVLRKAWSYDGLMVTNWDIIGRMHRGRRICATTEEGAKRALRAGNDMIMTTPSFCQDTLDALARGEADMADVNAAVRNVLRLKFRLGLPENPRLPDIPKAVAIAAEPASARWRWNRPASRWCCEPAPSCRCGQTA